RRSTPQGGPRQQCCLGPEDVASYGVEAGLGIYEASDSAAKVAVNLAARPVTRAPYLQHTQAFSDDEDAIFAVLDSTAMPPGGAGARYAAYYTVPHRSVAGWADATPLLDVSGGI